jgi:hypothetical protein
VDLGPDALSVEPLGVVTEAAQLPCVLLEVGDLVRARGHVENADGLVARVDPEALDRLDDPSEVLAPELLEAGHLLAEALEAVGETVRQRGVAEASVTAARSERDPLALEDDDRGVRIGLPGLDRGPEAGETAADDREVAAELPLRGGPGLGPVGGVEPEGPSLGIRKRLLDAASHGAY